MGRKYLTVLAETYRRRIVEILMFSVLAMAGVLWQEPYFPIRHPVLLFQFGAALFFFYSHAFFFNDWADCKDGRLDSLVLLWSGVSLAVSFLLFFWVSRSSFGFMLLLLAISMAYSHPRLALKTHPVLSSALHLLGGAIQFLAGVSAAGEITHHAVLVGMYAGLLLVAGHMTQEVEHYEADRAKGVTTHAVRFGPQATFRASLGIFLFSSLYLGVLGAVGRVPVVVAFAGGLAMALQMALWLVIRKRERRLNSYRMGYRSIYAGLALVWYYFHCIS